MADLIVDSHLIAAFRNRINTLDAISEFFDNSGAVGATNLSFAFRGDSVAVVDNGPGLKNLNLLVKLGGSYSDNTTINVYGIGAKEAALHFGSLMIMESVCQGKYYHYELDWDEVQNKGTPKPHNSRLALPLSKAPSVIRGGGTRITIKRLSLGRPKIYRDVLLKRLSHRYRPALRKGKSISVAFAADRGQDAATVKLSAQADFIGLWKNEREIMGMAADRAFSARYTDLKEYDRNLTGIHIGYGDRFIEHLDKLGGKTLPPLFYAEVMLGTQWRECLSPNKTALVLFRDELEAAVFELLKDWIKELEAFSDEVRIEKLNVLLQKHTADIFVFKAGGDGYRKDKPTIVTDVVPGPGPVPDPDPHVEDHEAIEDPAGKGSKEKRKRRPSGIHFKRNDKLGNIPFTLDTNLSDQQITVFLNGSIPAIDNAYRVPYKIPALWPLIAAAFSGWVRDNIKFVDNYLPGFLDTLSSLGYEIDREKPGDVELYVLTWMMRQHPPASLKELEAKEVAA